MKKKNFNKKLNLSKKTVANLSNSQMNRLVGGNDPPVTYTRIVTECPQTTGGTFCGCQG